MVFLRVFLVFIVILMSGLPSFCENSWVTKEGYYVDRTLDIRNSTSYPPHPENIPVVSSPIQTTVDFEDYYNVNVDGYRGRIDKLPLVPGYTENYSTRKPTVYTKKDYVNVWCDGQKNAGKVDCLTDKEALSFFPLSSWTTGITRASWRARKLAQEGVAVLYVEDLGALSSDMYEAKKWAEKWGVKLRFITIDTEIPLDWIY